jgi:hypothetical protein
MTSRIGLQCVFWLSMLFAACLPKKESAQRAWTDTVTASVIEPTMAPNESTEQEPRYQVKNDNPELIGTWVSRHLSNTEFGYAVELTNEKFRVIYTGNELESPPVEGSWTFLQNTLTLFNQNDSLVFVISHVDADKLVITQVEVKVEYEPCTERAYARENKIQSAWYRDHDVALNAENLAGNWASIDGDFSLKDNGEYEECCAGGEWTLVADAYRLDLHETWLEAEAEPSDQVWMILSNSALRLTINHGYPNPEANYDHVYFKKLSEEEVNFIEPVITVRPLPSQEAFIKMCRVIFCG